MTVYDYFTLFMIYSFIGWCIEVAVSLIQRKHFINRGFLIGPYCPIYGCACLFITITLKKYLNDLIVLFVMNIFICSILEYFTSYLMEKLFKARWWDYSKKILNINGRICLETMLPFGVLGCLVMYIINPFLVSVITAIPNYVIIIVSISVFIIFIADFAISFKIISSFKKTTRCIAKDSTEEITKKVRNILAKKSILTKRLIDAFPMLKVVKFKFRKD